MAFEPAGQPLFDMSREYEQELNRGLAMSGDDRDFYLEGRLADLMLQLGDDRPGRVLDFGCGFGDTSARLAALLPDAEILGIDTAPQAVEYANQTHGSDRVRFAPVEGFDARDAFDLCYVNGVFHHIQPPDRKTALQIVLRTLAPGGRFALFENNPWNPGTRLLMSRLEFDDDAVPISAPEARRLLLDAGFAHCASPRFVFWFPAPLAFLRFLEPGLVRVPMGAQYSILATKASPRADAAG